MQTGEAPKRQELRCFCSRTPLLAVYGVGNDKRPFIHVKIYKQGRIYGELVLKGGEVNIKCRECYRWYIVYIQDTGPTLKESIVPLEIDSDEQDELESSGGAL